MAPGETRQVFELMAVATQNVLNLRWGLLAGRELGSTRGLQALSNHGVAHAEIPGEYLTDAGDKQIAQMLSLCRAKQLKVWSVRLPFRDNDDIADPDDDVRQATVTHYAELIRKTSVMGCEVAVLTPSHQKSTRVHPDDIVSAICRSLDDLLPVAEKHNVRLAMKNLLQPYFGCRPEHFDMVLSLYPSRHLGCCFDSGHAHLNHCFEDMLDVMWPRLLNVHLHDNLADRDWHLQPGYGNAPLSLLFRRIAEMGWSSPVIIEARPWGKFDGPRLFLEMDALVNFLVGKPDDFPTLRAPHETLGAAWPADWMGCTTMRCPLSGHFVVFYRDRAVSPAREWRLDFHDVSAPATLLMPASSEG